MILVEIEGGIGGSDQTTLVRFDALFEAIILLFEMKASSDLSVHHNSFPLLLFIPVAENVLSFRL
jgi:hypothetical protein